MKNRTKCATLVVVMLGGAGIVQALAAVDTGKMKTINDAVPYIVINLSGGANMASYPVRFSDKGPNIDDNTCRTTELWLRRIMPGTFTMGSPATELGRLPNETRHSVTISRPFYIGVFEITQRQYYLVTGLRPSCYGGDLRPVERVSYDDIRGVLVGANWPLHGQVDSDSFLGKIRARTALSFDLPTEAQWEYACRAGTTTALNNGKDLKNVLQDAAMAEVGRYSYNWTEGKGGYSDFHTTVGSYRANTWGLYDMHGNVYEWCLDWYGNYATGTVSNPKGCVSGVGRVLRGGIFNDDARGCRSSCRFYYYPAIRYGFIGFRLCCPAETAK